MRQNSTVKLYPATKRQKSKIHTNLKSKILVDFVAKRSLKVVALGFKILNFLVS